MKISPCSCGSTALHISTKLRGGRVFIICQDCCQGVGLDVFYPCAPEDIVREWNLECAREEEAVQ